MQRDYVDKKLEKAVERAAEILLARLSEWGNEVEAYWVLRRVEDDLGVPVTYDIVEAAVSEALRRAPGLRAAKSSTAKAEA